MNKPASEVMISHSLLLRRNTDNNTNARRRRHNLAPHRQIAGIPFPSAARLFPSARAQRQKVPQLPLPRRPHWYI
jgi:hypothetical protein